MKKIISVLLAGIMGLTLFSSCEEDKEPIDVTKNAFLYQRAWKLVGLQQTLNIDAETPIWNDLYVLMEPCEQDDYMYFHTKSSGATFDYFIKCSSTDVDSTNFWYNITDNDSYITVYTNPDDMASSIVLQGGMSTPHIDTFRVTYTYFNEGTELNEQIQYTFEKIVPTDF